MKNKSGLFEKIIYNNKILFVFSLVFSIALWAVIKVNFSSDSIRNLSDIKISIDASLAEENGYRIFADEDDLAVDVEVSGKSYDLSAYSLDKSDIIVEATAGYVDSAGYKVLNITARSVLSDVTVTGIYPSTITVFFDREATDTFNVEARLKNKASELVSGDYVAGQPVASLNTVEVSGPASVVSSINKVYFETEFSSEELPLEATKEKAASLVYDTENERGNQFLVCKSIDDKSNPATVTVPVSIKKTIKTDVKFVNEPAYFETDPPKISISPSTVDILMNTHDEKDIPDSIIVGTIDFKELENKNNKLIFDADEKSLALFADKTKNSFSVNVDLSDYSSKTFEELPGNIVVLNQTEGYKYDVDLNNSSFETITVYGPSKSLKKIKAEDLQAEINVYSLDLNNAGRQKVEISNISIQSETVDDCWVYGTYYAYVTVSEK